jgi:hypothetical protein
MSADNRSVTLRGQNKIFGTIGIQIFRHDLNYYYLEYRGVQWSRPTLTELCQDFIYHLVESREAADNG